MNSNCAVWPYGHSNEQRIPPEPTFRAIRVRSSAHRSSAHGNQKGTAASSVSTSTRYSPLLQDRDDLVKTPSERRNAQCGVDLLSAARGVKQRRWEELWMPFPRATRVTGHRAVCRVLPTLLLKGREVTPARPGRGDPELLGVRAALAPQQLGWVTLT